MNGIENCLYQSHKYYCDIIGSNLCNAYHVNLYKMSI